MGCFDEAAILAVFGRQVDILVFLPPVLTPYYPLHVLFHSDIAVFKKLMTEKTVYLLFGHMLLMYKSRVLVMFYLVHMAEETLFLGNEGAFLDLYGDVTADA